LHELKAVLGRQRTCCVDSLIRPNVIGISERQGTALIDEIVTAPGLCQIVLRFEVCAFWNGLQAVGVVESIFGIERSLNLRIYARIAKTEGIEMQVFGASVVERAVLNPAVL
jgi:hypothetical protein